VVQAAETLVDVARRRRDFDMLKALTIFERCDPEVIRQAETVT
jgi:hypothetical protein